MLRDLLLANVVLVFTVLLGFSVLLKLKPKRGM